MFPRRIAREVPNKYSYEFEIKSAFTGKADDRKRWTRPSGGQP